MDIALRPLRPEDREPIRRILQATAVFRPEELEVAFELVDVALDKPDQRDYTFAVAECGGAVAGYACWGETPCTRGTFDLYWIATDPALHGKGVGGRLMDFAEEEMRARGGRLCVIETSSLPPYEPTRRFYLGRGYAEAARLKNFYTDGDDKVIYLHQL
jgi:ribosomal protein S18 acetylase RimI-like enzyme